MLLGTSAGESPHFWVEGVNWVQSSGYLIGFSAVTIGINYSRGRTLVRMEELRLAAERASQPRPSSWPT